MESSAPTLLSVFNVLNGKEKTMEGKVFTKMAKDAGLMAKTFTATDVDIIFAKAKSKAERRLTFAQFQTAVGYIAEKKGQDVESIKYAIIQSGGPKFTGTTAEANKFHDDKSLYTGVHGHGGPTTVD